MKPGWQTARYPNAEWVPWRYPAGTPSEHVGKPTYYANMNQPIAVILHVMQGYQRTARQWAESGMYPKSWHFSVARDGSTMQHLDFRHGGYHAGITDAVATLRPPTWRLWKGKGVNVNWYTIGIEHEGFAGEPFTEPQTWASIQLCLWLADVLEIPVDYDHFPPHAAIDVRDRFSDFNVPWLRDIHYSKLFAEADDMSAEDKARIERLERLIAANGIRVPDDAGEIHMTGEAALAYLDNNGWSARMAVDNLNVALRNVTHGPESLLQEVAGTVLDINAALREHTTNHPGGVTRDDIAKAAQAFEDSILEG